MVGDSLQQPRESHKGRVPLTEHAVTEVPLHTDMPWDMPPGASPQLLEVLESAADLQERVPGTVLVGGAASALYAGHRDSFDHDHVLRDLSDRYEMVLDALERESDWVTNRVVPGKIILGELGEIETGVRQLIRVSPLEVTRVRMPSGKLLTVPTEAEILRVKAFLIVKRNQLRDYLDVAALSHRYGTEFAADTLLRIDDYYSEPRKQGTPVADQVQRQLGNPQPKDHRTIGRLPAYKNLHARWHDWASTVRVLNDVSDEMLERKI